MKSISKILVITLAILLSGCVNNRSMDIEYLNKSQVDGSIGEWVNSISNNGAFLAKDSDGKKLVLYLNYSEQENNQYYHVPSVSINYSQKQLTISSVPRVSQEPYAKVYVITLNGNKIKRIFINEREIDIDRIEEIGQF